LKKLFYFPHHCNSLSKRMLKWKVPSTLTVFLKSQTWKTYNYKTLQMNPNNTICSNLENSELLVTIPCSQLKRNTQKVKQHVFDQAKHEHDSLSIPVNHMLVYILHRQKHITVKVYSSTKKAKTRTCSHKNFLSIHTNNDNTDGPQSN